MKKSPALLLPLLLITILFYLPTLVNPGLVLERGNDLQEFFRPQILFIKNQLAISHQLPLWYNTVLSGTPLLPDPQSQLFYLPNIIFLFLPIGVAFLASMFLHTLVGGIGAYLASRQGFGFNKSASLFAAVLYILTSRTAAYLEAGHFGLVAATAWVPFVLLAVMKLVKKPIFPWSFLLAVGLSGLFYTHPTTFAIMGLGTGAMLVLRKSYFPLLFSFTIAFGLIAISLLPQLEWMPQTSRVVLIDDRQVWPKWHSLEEFSRAVLVPWWQGISASWQLDTEKWIALGIVPSLIAGYGFLKVKRRAKVALTILTVGVVLVALNNASPLHGFFISQNWFIYARVATRVWFVLGLSIAFLAAYAFQKLTKKWGKRAVTFVAVLAVFELTAISWLRILKPTEAQLQFAPREVLDFLAQDRSRFRVFCVNRCIRQADAVKHELELVEGYSTLVSMNYYKHAWQLTGTYWDYYSLAVPPIGAYKFDKLQPDAVSLGEYNTKYVISLHELEDENLVLKEKFGDYLVYLNKALKPRASVPITKYTPNHIRLDTQNFTGKQIVVAEVYNPGWKAYLNGEEKVQVQETPQALRAVDIKPDTDFVDFKYEPESYKWGRIITFSTIALLSAYAVLRRIRPKLLERLRRRFSRLLKASRIPRFNRG